MNRFNDDGYTPVDDDEVTTSKSTELSIKQLARAKAQEDAMLADDGDYTTVAPTQHTETITKESDTITIVNNEVSSQSHTDVPMDTIDHTDVDFSTEEVVDIPLEALRSPVVDVAGIAKIVATNDTISVPRTLQEIRLAENAEIKAFKAEQKKRNALERTTIYKRLGTKPVWVGKAEYRALIRAVLNGASSIEEAFTIARGQAGVRLPMADTERLYKFKYNKESGKPNVLKDVLLDLADTDTNLKNILKHTLCTKQTLKSNLSTKSVKTMMLELMNTKKFTDNQIQMQTELTTNRVELATLRTVHGAAIETLNERITRLEDELALKNTVTVAVTKAQAVTMAKQLKQRGLSNRAISRELAERGYSATDMTVAKMLPKS